MLLTLVDGSLLHIPDSSSLNDVGHLDTLDSLVLLIHQENRLSTARIGKSGPICKDGGAVAGEVSMG
jgi:hypothetical protein